MESRQDEGTIELFSRAQGASLVLDIGSVSRRSVCPACLASREKLLGSAVSEPDTAIFFWRLAPWLAAGAAILAFVLKLRVDGLRRASAAPVVQSAEAMLRPVTGYALVSAASVWILIALYMPNFLVVVGHPGAAHAAEVRTMRVGLSSP